MVGPSAYWKDFQFSKDPASLGEYARFGRLSNLGGMLNKIGRPQTS